MTRRRTLGRIHTLALNVTVALCTLASAVPLGILHGVLIQPPPCVLFESPLVHFIHKHRNNLEITHTYVLIILKLLLNSHKDVFACKDCYIAIKHYLWHKEEVRRYLFVCFYEKTGLPDSSAENGARCLPVQVSERTAIAQTSQDTIHPRAVTLTTKDTLPIRLSTCRIISWRCLHRKFHPRITHDVTSSEPVTACCRLPTNQRKAHLCVASITAVTLME